MMDWPQQPEPAPADRPFKAGRYYLLACAFYAVLVIYGSLVPLNYRGVPFELAWRTFVRVFEGRTPLSGYWSRSDVIANFCLFVPLAFLAMGAVTRGGKVRGGLMLAVLVLPLLTAFGAAIEFLQIHFPDRNPSRRDVLVQAGGSVLGILLWAVMGRFFTRYMHGLTHYTTLKRPGVQLLGGYLVGLFLYNLVPFNLTLSPKEMIYDKLKQGQINLVPFADPVGYGPYIAFAKFALFVPIGAFFALAYPRARMRAALGLGMLYSAMTELAQLLVVDRFTSVTDVVLGSAGCLLGGGLVAMMSQPVGPQTRPLDEDGVPLPEPKTFWGRWGWEVKLVLTLIYLGALLLMHWWPLEFHTPSRGLLKEAWRAIRVPFYHQYYDHPFQAFTIIARTVGWFFVLGLLLRSLWPLRCPVGAMLSLVLLGILVAGIEFAQVGFAGRVPDLTSIILGWTGGLVAVLLQPALALMIARSASGAGDPQA